MPIWSSNCVISSNAAADQEITFAMTDPVVTLSTQDNAKLLQQLEWGFKHIFFWSKY